MVCINYKDPQVLIKEAKEASELGFHGKQAINPDSEEEEDDEDEELDDASDDSGGEGDGDDLDMN